jgi:glutathione S-transferase
MEARLVEHPWLVGEKYTIADAAFTPYVVRLEHLDILQLLNECPKVLDWYNRLKARPSFEAAIVQWENPDYLALMKRQGRENCAKIREVIAR